MKQFLPLLLILTSLAGYGQRKSLIGFSANLTDFETPGKIQQTSLGDVLKNGFFGKMNPGFSLMYWKGLGNRTDFSVRYNGVFSTNGFTSTKTEVKEYFNELEGSLHLRAFSDDKVLNPFLSAGVALGNYWKNEGIAGYAPLGLGLQLNLMDESYFFLQANYRLSFDDKKLPNNLFYSFGITQSLHAPKEEKPVLSVPTQYIENKDRDNDGVENDEDECPDAAGTVALKGCPDADNDGVSDKEDKCPTVAGSDKYQGCPVPDSDNDGINDEADKCPHTAGIARYNGCPVPDRDNDGVNDEEDKCPDAAGPASNHGCPVIKEEITEKVNTAAKNIYFMTGKDILDKKSYTKLNEIAEVLKADPSLKMQITGHTDNVGSDEINQALSSKRAAAVKNYLIQQGISENRITTLGMGSNNPIADNATAAGRAKNRRVEMTIRNY